MSDELYTVMTMRSDNPKAVDRFLNLAQEAFDREATAAGMIAGEMRVCQGHFDFDAPYMGEWPPLPAGNDPACIAFCDIRHPGSV